MPEITSCPECEKKLRVPDDLLGKKVRCPGCSVMFIAQAGVGALEEAPKTAARAAPRSDAVSQRRPAAPPPEEDEEERPRGRRRQEEDDREDEERPSARRRRDEEDEEERPRRGQRDEEEEGDRPRRGRRDEEDEDDRRISTRRNDDRRSRFRREEDEEDDIRDRIRRRDDDEMDSDDRPSDQVRGWGFVRLGLTLVLFSSLMILALYGFSAIVEGIRMLIGRSAFAAFATGDIQSILAGRGQDLVSMLMSILMGLCGLGSFLMTLIGMGLCMCVPAKRTNQKAKTLAILAFAGVVGAILSIPLSLAVLFIIPLGSILLYILAVLLAIAGGICWLLFLSAVAEVLNNREVARRVLNYLVAVIVIPVLWFFVQLIMGLAGLFALAAVMMVLSVVGSMALSFWYVSLLIQVRGVVDRHLSRI